MKMTVKSTRVACYLGYVVQATVINLPPLLFVTFQNRYGISLGKLGILVSFCFIVQIVTDLVGARYIDRIGYRRCTVFANWTAALGLVLLGVLPQLMVGAEYLALLIAVLFFAVGGGLIDLLVSPIIDSIPGEKKAAEMSLLHSFYCWGFVAVVLLSTLFFALCGTASWQLLVLLWALLPLCTGILFCFVPIFTPPSGEARTPLRRLFTSGTFWLLLLCMIASGAAEQAVSQWASLFAETGLNVSKTAGDLLGPCLFAACMASVRMLYGFSGERIRMRTALLCSAGLCVAGYAMIGLGTHPAVSLAGCAAVGLAVALMWPGALSLSSGFFPAGGTAMFALLALAGDAGCSSGSGLVGWISDALTAAGQTTTAALKTALLCAAVFPVLLAVFLLLLRRREK